ncbi:MAG: helix-turn-helix transcriptional regulator [Elusimicrobia bacterium]|nr:helix-turn-helix transcriptional regulator [Elusimicrobiota bacterium]
MMTKDVLEKGTEKALLKAPKIRLKDREWMVLSALGRWGILGLGQLDGLVFRECANEEKLRLFFNEYDRISFDHYAYKRLRRLEKAGLVQGHSKGQSVEGPRRLYSLTRLGRGALVEARRSAGSLRRSWSSEAAWHHVRLNAVGLVLERILGMKVAGRHELAALNRGMGLSEAQIRKSIPDLLIGERTPLMLVSRGSGAGPGYGSGRPPAARAGGLNSRSIEDGWRLKWPKSLKFLCRSGRSSTPPPRSLRPWSHGRSWRMAMSLACTTARQGRPATAASLEHSARCSPWPCIGVPRVLKSIVRCRTERSTWKQGTSSRSRTASWRSSRTAAIWRKPTASRSVSSGSNSGEARHGPSSEAICRVMRRGT